MAKIQSLSISNFLKVLAISDLESDGLVKMIISNEVNVDKIYIHLREEDIIEIRDHMNYILEKLESKTN
jgi:hypothetical protein